MAHKDNIRHVLYRIVAYVLQETGINAAENFTKGRHPVPGSILNQTSRNIVTITLLPPFLLQAFFYKLISASPSIHSAILLLGKSLVASLSCIRSHSEYLIALYGLVHRENSMQSEMFPRLRCTVVHSA